MHPDQLTPPSRPQCAYWRVDRCGDLANLLGKRYWLKVRCTFSIHAVSDCRVCSVISNCTGQRVLCYMTMARGSAALPWATSKTRKLTKSQPRSLLSIARLNSAKSRACPASWSLIRIAQISFSLSGAFWPTSLPLFQGTETWEFQYGIS